MAVDSFIIKGLQGEETDLEQRLIGFLNQNPPKKILNITSWTIGIEICILILYQVGKPPEIPQPKIRTSDGVSTITGVGKGEY